MILAGLLLKTGAYGMIRFVVPLFPGAARDVRSRRDDAGGDRDCLRRRPGLCADGPQALVAYTSISHLGFVLLGIFAGNTLALQGAVMTMICHGISTGALFVLVGALQERMHTREMERMGGLWATVPG